MHALGGLLQRTLRTAAVVRGLPHLSCAKKSYAKDPGTSFVSVALYEFPTVGCDVVKLTNLHKNVFKCRTACDTGGGDGGDRKRYRQNTSLNDKQKSEQPHARSIAGCDASCSAAHDGALTIR